LKKPIVIIDPILLTEIIHQSPYIQTHTQTSQSNQPPKINSSKESLVYKNIKLLDIEIIKRRCRAYTGPSNVSMLLKPRYLDAAPRNP
jgi:hypothetical protein